MTSNFMAVFASRLLSYEPTKKEYSLRGCKNSEVEEIERANNVILPPIYRAYLLTMGKSTGEFLRGAEHCYPDLLGLRKGADKLISECETKFRLSSTDFVFWMSEGTQFLFFDTVSGDDPPVFYFKEGGPEPIEGWNHYSEALEFFLKDQIKNQNASQKDK